MTLSPRLLLVRLRLALPKHGKAELYDGEAIGLLLYPPEWLPGGH
jgi:hypothetical protein